MATKQLRTAFFPIREALARAARHSVRGIAASLLAGGVLVAVMLAGVQSASAQVGSNPFSTDGSVVSSGQPIPNVPGTTGSFVLGSLTNTTGYISPAENASGQVTIDETSSTSYYSCNSAGKSCTVSSAASVVAPGNELFVSGHYFVENGTYELIAEYVFSPPPASSTAPPAPPAPQPTGFYDYIPANAFGVTGYVTSPGTYLVNQLLWSPLWGFTLGHFGRFPNGYGCGSASNCTTEQIALSNSNHLFIDATSLTTTFWLASATATTSSGEVVGCSYSQSTDTFAVIDYYGSKDGLTATGRFLYSGNQWRFTASNVFSPPPAPPSAYAAGGVCASTPQRIGPVSASSPAVSESSHGTAQPGGTGYDNTTWQGTFGTGFGPEGGVFSDGTIQLTLDWALVPAAGNLPEHWHFYGTYTASNQSGSTTLAGQISGSAGVASTGAGTEPVNATMTMDQGTGQFAGFSGYGTVSGDAAYSAGQPLPVLQSLDFVWNIQSTSSSGT